MENRTNALNRAADALAAGENVRISRSIDRAARRLEKTLMERGVTVIFVSPLSSGSEIAEEIALLLRLGVDVRSAVAVVEDPDRTEGAVFDVLSRARVPFAGVVDEILVAPW
jgi:predicted CoA-binding protein